MSYKVSDEDVELMRCVLGSGPSEMDLIRALHLAKNDVNLAFNVLFDTIGYKGTETNVKRTTAGSGARVLTTCHEQVPSIIQNSDTTIKREHMPSSLISDLDMFTNDHVESIKEEENRGFCFPFIDRAFLFINKQRFFLSIKREFDFSSIKYWPISFKLINEYINAGSSYIQHTS